MEKVELFKEENNITEESYMIEKVTWEKYDMTKTTSEVKSFIREYKEKKSICIQANALESSGLTTNLDINKIFSPIRSNNGGFADSVNERIDADRFVKFYKPILEDLFKTFTRKEKVYYDYCLLNNYSEEFTRRILNGLSKNGLQPIKNSCILKIALAISRAVKKDKNW